MTARWAGLTVRSVFMGAVLVLLPSSFMSAGSQLVLEDFHAKDPEGLPVEWKGEGLRSAENAKRTYTVESENNVSFLKAKNVTQRVHKKMAWDPKAMPIVTWRWRLHAAPAGAEPIAAVYVSLDTDVMFIPVSTKYIWSSVKTKGTISEVGLFGVPEIVVRSGPQPMREWVEERVNAHEDFMRIHGHEPAPQAWGISLLGGPGVEIDFGSIMVSAP